VAAWEEINPTLKVMGSSSGPGASDASGWSDAWEAWVVAGAEVGADVVLSGAESWLHPHIIEMESTQVNRTLNFFILLSPFILFTIL